MSSEHARHWRLDPTVVFLNHGSFGACPTAVLEEQQRLRDRLEAEPVRFYMRDLEGLLAEACGALARFVGADPADLAFVPNATTGVNAVLRSMELRSGDDLLITDHGYNACNNAAHYVAARAGATVTVARLPFPLQSPDEIVRSILAAATPRTRLALIDHVTSPSGLVLPVERIVKELAARGIDTLVDGAHAPGMVPLDLRALGAAYYTANCHKWLCAPKGSAFLWVRPDRQERVRPTVISHGANAPLAGRSRFRVEFDWTGTSDVTAWLCVPTALKVVGGLLPGGWPAVMERNRALALEGRRILAAALGLEAPCPDSMIGSLAALPLPDGAAPPAASMTLDPLQDELWLRHRIEVPVMTLPSPPKRLIRISAQLYNDAEQYRALAAALPRR